MKEIIGVTAGKIWLTLGENGKMSIPQLAKLIKENETIVSQALGWLAREGKIGSELKGITEYFSLTHVEHEIYLKKQAEG